MIKKSMQCRRLMVAMRGQLMVLVRNCRVTRGWRQQSRPFCALLASSGERTDEKYGCLIKSRTDCPEIFHSVATEMLTQALWHFTNKGELRCGLCFENDSKQIGECREILIWTQVLWQVVMNDQTRTSAIQWHFEHHTLTIDVVYGKGLVEPVQGTMLSFVEQQNLQKRL